MHADGEVCVEYERKLHDPGWALSPRPIAPGEALVLFEYVTHSYHEFMGQKEPKLTGVYADFFRDRWEASRAALVAAAGVSEVSEIQNLELGLDADKVPETEVQREARTAFDEFEEKHRFNLEGSEHPTCASVVEADYVSRCCRTPQTL